MASQAVKGCEIKPFSQRINESINGQDLNPSSHQSMNRPTTQPMNRNGPVDA